MVSHPPYGGTLTLYYADVQPYPVPVAGGWAYVCGAGHTHASEEAAGRCGTVTLPERLREYVRQEWPGLSDAQREGVYGEYLRYLTTGEGNAHTAAIMSAWVRR